MLSALASFEFHWGRQSLPHWLFYLEADLLFLMISIMICDIIDNQEEDHKNNGKQTNRNVWKKSWKKILRAANKSTLCKCSVLFDAQFCCVLFCFMILIVMVMVISWCIITTMKSSRQSWQRFIFSSSSEKNDIDCEITAKENRRRKQGGNGAGLVKLIEADKDSKMWKAANLVN